MELVEHVWGYREHHRRELIAADRDRQAIENAAIRNAAAQALGYVEIVGEPDVQWCGLDDVEVTQLSRIDLDSDPWAKSFGPDGPTEEQVIVEEERRRAWWRDCRELRVTWLVRAEPERPVTTALSEETHAALREQGVQVMRDRRAATFVCGGAFRRHSFMPREAAWMRDGLIEHAKCGDCDQDVKRSELMERAANEARYGYCHVDGDAFVAAAGNRPALICPTCTAALRQ